MISLRFYQTYNGNDIILGCASVRRLPGLRSRCELPCVCDKLYGSFLCCLTVKCNCFICRCKSAKIFSIQVSADFLLFLCANMYNF